jgi:hypothetical protein
MVIGLSPSAAAYLKLNRTGFVGEPTQSEEGPMGRPSKYAPELRGPRAIAGEDCRVDAVGHAVRELEGASLVFISVGLWIYAMKSLKRE